MKKNLFRLALTALLPLFCLALSGAAQAAGDAEGDYQAGQTYDGGIDENVTSIGSGPAATETGPITGTGTYSVTGPGTLNLRYISNVNFTGKINLISGNLNILDRRHMIKELANFKFLSGDTGATGTALSVSINNLRYLANAGDQARADYIEAVLTAVTNLDNSTPTLSIGTDTDAVAISFDGEDGVGQALALTDGKSGRIRLSKDSTLTFENYKDSETGGYHGAVLLYRVSGSLSTLTLSGEEGSRYIFSGNETGGGGGAIVNYGGNKLVVATDILFEYNKAGQFGVVVQESIDANFPVSVFLGETVFRGNSGWGSGALYNAASPTNTQSTSYIVFEGPVSFIDNQTDQNSTDPSPGAIYNGNRTYIVFLAQAVFLRNPSP